MLGVADTIFFCPRHKRDSIVRDSEKSAYVGTVPEPTDKLKSHHHVPPEGLKADEYEEERNLHTTNKSTMKFSTVAAICALAVPTSAFAPVSISRSSTALNAEIRGPTEKAKVLENGWDGTTALGGAVEVAAPARMLDEIRAAGETIPPDCEVFNANVEMDAADLKFEEVIELIDTHYESGLVEFKNGDIVNKPGENEGSAKVLSYAALSEMDKETTLKVRLGFIPQKIANGFVVWKR